MHQQGAIQLPLVSLPTENTCFYFWHDIRFIDNHYQLVQYK